MSLLEDAQQEMMATTRPRVGRRAPAKGGKKKAKSVPKKAPKKAPAKSGKKKTDKNAPAKARKSRNNKPTIIDTSGIGIQPMLVKQVLVSYSLNPRESQTKVAINLAECRPAKAPAVKAPSKSQKKPRKKASKPAVIPSVPTPVAEMLPEHLRVIKEAEESYRATLRSKYEKEVYLANLQKKDEKKHQAYMEARKKAHKEPGFDLVRFNESFDPKFYGKAFDRFVKEHDAYDDEAKYNEWRRARILVTKMCIRTSRNTRNIIAAFLDLIIEQFARNGIQNCISTKKRIVQIWHALKETGSFDDSVPLQRFVRTFRGYDDTLRWIREYGKSRVAGTESKQSTLPKLQFDEGTKKFNGYVGNIVKSVRTRLAKGARSSTEQNNYNQLRVGGNFKAFFSYVAFETIVRIGQVLLCSVELGKVKTISDNMTFSALKEVCSACGVDFGPIEEEISKKLEQYAEWSEERKELKKQKKQKKLAEEAEGAAEEEKVNISDPDEEEESGDEEEEHHDDEDEDEEESGDEENTSDLVREDGSSDDEDDDEDDEED
jgi:hypothetical protein